MPMSPRTMISAERHGNRHTCATVVLLTFAALLCLISPAHARFGGFPGMPVMRHPMSVDDVSSAYEDPWEATGPPTWSAPCEFTTSTSSCGVSPVPRVPRADYDLCGMPYVADGWVPEPDDIAPFIELDLPEPVTNVSLVEINDKGSRGWIARVELVAVDGRRMTVFEIEPHLQEVPSELYKPSPPEGLPTDPYYAPGLDYRGGVNVSISNLNCRPWNEAPNIVKDVEYGTAGDHNFCRNPTNDPAGVWCFTGPAGTAKQQCVIPPTYQCDDSPLFFYPNMSTSVWKRLRIELRRTWGAYASIDSATVYGDSVMGCFNNNVDGHFLEPHCDTCRFPFKGGNCLDTTCGGSACQFGDCDMVVPTQCNCRPGFYGSDCANLCPSQQTIADVLANGVVDFGAICSGHGMCNDGAAGSGACTCHPDFAGASCNIACPRNPGTGIICSGGTCSNGTAGDGTCSCEGNTYGEACEKQLCGGIQCYNGDCQSGVCVCYFDATNGFWAGTNCDTCASGYVGTTCSQIDLKTKVFKGSWTGYKHRGNCEPWNPMCNESPDIKLLVRVNSLIQISGNGTGNFRMEIDRTDRCKLRVDATRPTFECSFRSEEVGGMHEQQMAIYIFSEGGPESDSVSNYYEMEISYMPSCADACEPHGYCFDSHPPEGMYYDPYYYGPMTSHRRLLSLEKKFDRLEDMKAKMAHYQVKKSNADRHQKLEERNVKRLAAKTDAKGEHGESTNRKLLMPMNVNSPTISNIMAFSADFSFDVTGAGPPGPNAEMYIHVYEDTDFATLGPNDLIDQVNGGAISNTKWRAEEFFPSGPGPFARSMTIDWLTPSTTYEVYWETLTTNSFRGDNFGGPLTFTTSPPPPPLAVQTPSVTNMQYLTADFAFTADDIGPNVNPGDEGRVVFYVFPSYNLPTLTPGDLLDDMGESWKAVSDYEFHFPGGSGPSPRNIVFDNLEPDEDYEVFYETENTVGDTDDNFGAPITFSTIPVPTPAFTGVEPTSSQIRVDFNNPDPMLQLMVCVVPQGNAFGPSDMEYDSCLAVDATSRGYLNFGPGPQQYVLQELDASTAHDGYAMYRVMDMYQYYHYGPMLNAGSITTTNIPDILLDPSREFIFYSAGGTTMTLEAFINIPGEVKLVARAAASGPIGDRNQVYGAAVGTPTGVAAVAATTVTDPNGDFVYLALTALSPSTNYIIEAVTAIGGGATISPVVGPQPFTTPGTAPTLTNVAVGNIRATSVEVTGDIDRGGKLFVAVRLAGDPAPSPAQMLDADSVQPAVSWASDRVADMSYPTTGQVYVDGLTPESDYKVHMLATDENNQTLGAVQSIAFSTNLDGTTACDQWSFAMSPSDVICTTFASTSAGNPFFCECNSGFLCDFNPGNPSPRCVNEEAYYESLSRKGSCSCDANSHQGHWNGTDCSFCKNNYFGSDCTKQCVRGFLKADKSGCTCPGGTFFEGEQCDLCPAINGYYGTDCNEQSPIVSQKLSWSLPPRGVGYYGVYKALTYSLVTVTITVSSPNTIADINQFVIMTHKQWEEASQFLKSEVRDSCGNIISSGIQGQQEGPEGPGGTGTGGPFGSGSGLFTSSSSGSGSGSGSGFNFGVPLGADNRAFIDCTEEVTWDGTATTATCEMTVASGYNYFSLHAEMKDKRVDLNVRFSTVTGCCNGNGFCQIDTNKCECVKDPELGFYDTIGECVSCMKGYSGARCNEVDGTPSAYWSGQDNLNVGESAWYAVRHQSLMPVVAELRSDADCDLDVRVTSVCGEGWMYRNGNCFKFFGDPGDCTDVSNATQVCEQEGGELATFRDADDLIVFQKMWEDLGVSNQQLKGTFCSNVAHINLRRAVPPCGAGNTLNETECNAVTDPAACYWDLGQNKCVIDTSPIDCWVFMSGSCKAPNGGGGAFTDAWACDWMELDGTEKGCLPGWQFGGTTTFDVKTSTDFVFIDMNTDYSRRCDNEFTPNDCAQLPYCRWDPGMFQCELDGPWRVNSNEMGNYNNKTGFADQDNYCGAVYAPYGSGSVNLKVVPIPCTYKEQRDKSRVEEGKLNSPNATFFCQKPPSFTQSTVSGSPPNEILEQIPPARKAMGVPTCSQAGPESDHTCDLFSTTVDDYVIMKVTCLEQAQFSLNVSFVKWKNIDHPNPDVSEDCFNSAAAGSWAGKICAECAPRFSGMECDTFTGCVNNAECNGGTCLGNGYCDCSALVPAKFGRFCQKACVAGTCNGHGSCNANYDICTVPLGTSRACDVNAKICTCDPGYDGALCDRCVLGKYNPAAGCSGTCNCNGQPCDPVTGACACYADEVRGFWDSAANCGSCTTNYYSRTCNVLCIAATTCGGHGTCGSDGKCVCSADYYTATCGVYCTAATCSQHGTCNQFTGKCTCDASYVTGFYGGDTCSVCATGYWGATCSEECQCSARGPCDKATGECSCFDSDELGHFTGDRCRECMAGYTGVDCKTISASTKNELSTSPTYRVGGAARSSKGTDWGGAFVPFTIGTMDFTFVAASTQVNLFGRLASNPNAAWNFIDFCDMNSILGYGDSIVSGVLNGTTALFLLKGTERSFLLPLDTSSMDTMPINTSGCFFTSSDAVPLWDPVLMNNGSSTTAALYSHVAIDMILDENRYGLYILYTRRLTNGDANAQTTNKLSKVFLRNDEQMRMGFDNKYNGQSQTFEEFTEVNGITFQRDTSYPNAIIAGIDAGGNVRFAKVFLPTIQQRTIRTALTFVPRVCDFVACQRTLRITILRDLLYVALQTTSTTSDVTLARFNLTADALKQFDTHYAYSTVATNAVGCGFLSYDPFVDSLYVAVGNHTPSRIYKVDALTLDKYPASLTLSYEHTQTEYEVSVASYIDFNRRIMYVVNRATRINFFAMNLYDIEEISPTVADGRGGTNITIIGNGFKPIDGEKFRCRFGSFLSPARDSYYINKTHLVCKAPYLPSFDACADVSLEVSFYKKVRFTANNILIRHLNAATLTAVQPSDRVTLAPSEPIEILGTGFLPTDYLTCEISGTDNGTLVLETVPATYVSTSEVSCLPPPRTTPLAANIRVSLDGFKYSNSLPLYYVGEPVGMSASWEDVASGVTYSAVAEANLTLAALTISFVDRAGIAVGQKDEPIRGGNVTITLLSSKAPKQNRAVATNFKCVGCLNGTLRGEIDDGAVTFEDLFIEFPGNGEYTLIVSTDANVSTKTFETKFRITAEATALKFDREGTPQGFSTTRDALPVQPIVKFSDVSNNIADVADGTTLSVELTRADGRNLTDESLTGTDDVTQTAGQFTYSTLRIENGKEGELYFLNFTGETDGETFTLASVPIFISACPDSQDLISEIVPSAGMIGQSANVDIKGFGFVRTGKTYYCKFGEGTAALAVFKDSCTMSCDIPAQSTPTRAAVELLVSGATAYTTFGKEYAFVDSTGGIGGSFSTGVTSFPANDTVTLDDISIKFVDAIGSWMQSLDPTNRPVHITTDLPLENVTLPLNGSSGNNAEAVFGRLVTRLPTAKTYTVYFSTAPITSVPFVTNAPLPVFTAGINPPANALMMSTFTFSIVAGDAHHMKFVASGKVTPDFARRGEDPIPSRDVFYSDYITNRSKISNPMFIQIVDVAENDVVQFGGTTVAVSVQTIDPPPSVCIEEPTKNNKMNGSESCTTTRGTVVTAAAGKAEFRDLEFRHDTNFVIEFVSSLPGIPSLNTTLMRVADCHPTDTTLLQGIQPNWISIANGGVITVKGWGFEPDNLPELNINGTRYRTFYNDACSVIVSITATSGRRQVATEATKRSFSLVSSTGASLGSTTMTIEYKDTEAKFIGFSNTKVAVHPSTAAYRALTCSNTATYKMCYTVQDLILDLDPIHIALKDSAENDIFDDDGDVGDNGWGLANTGKNLTEASFELTLVEAPAGDTRTVLSQIISGPLTGTTVKGIATLTKLNISAPRSGSYLIRVNPTGAAAAELSATTFSLVFIPGLPISLGLVDEDGAALTEHAAHKLPYAKRQSNGGLGVNVRLADVVGNSVSIDQFTDGSRPTIYFRANKYASIQPTPIPDVLQFIANPPWESTSLIWFTTNSSAMNDLPVSNFLATTLKTLTDEFNTAADTILNMEFGYIYRVDFYLDQVAQQTAAGRTSVTSGAIVSLLVSHDLCAAANEYGVNGTSQCAAIPTGARRSATFADAAFLEAEPNYWRQSFTLADFYECPGTNCLGGFWSECKDGTGKTLCAVCDDNWGKQGNDCLECPSTAVNVLTLLGFGIAMLLVIYIMVSANLSTEVKPKSVFSIVIKILMNHLQTATLMRDFQAKVLGIVKDLMDVQEKSSPDTNISSFACVTGWNQYAIFLMWMIVPAVILTLPGLIAALIRALHKRWRRKNIEKVRALIKRRKLLGLNTHDQQVQLRSLETDELPVGLGDETSSDDDEGDESVTPPHSDDDSNEFEEILQNERHAKENAELERLEKKRVVLESKVSMLATAEMEEALRILNDPESTPEARAEAQRIVDTTEAAGSSAAAQQIPDAESRIITDAWEPITSRRSGKTFWRNASTGQTTWVRPPQAPPGPADPITLDVAEPEEDEAADACQDDFDGVITKDEPADIKPNGLRRKSSVSQKAPDGIKRCDICRVDFAIYECKECISTSDNDVVFCESCWDVVHSKEGRNGDHKRYECKVIQEGLPEVQAKYQALYAQVMKARSQIPAMEVYIVTVLVIVFLVYPRLISQIATMMKCKNIQASSQSGNTTTSISESYLLADMQISCDTDEYGRWRALAQIFFFIYGVGIPFGGFLVLWSKRKTLLHKKTLATYGFLYSGFRMKRYYWEMIIMVRKMLVVMIVVFYADEENFEYQILFGTWLISLFMILNIFLQPFQLKLYWRLENVSLSSVVISLNAAMLYQHDLDASSEALVTAFIFIVNVLALSCFAYYLFYAAKVQFMAIFDTDGSGDITWQEIMLVVRRKMFNNYNDQISEHRTGDENGADGPSRRATIDGTNPADSSAFGEVAEEEDIAGDEEALDDTNL